MAALCPILGSEQKNKVKGSSKYYLYYDKIKARVGGLDIGYYKNKYKQNKAKQIGLPVDPRIRKTISALRGVGPGQDPPTHLRRKQREKPPLKKQQRIPPTCRQLPPERKSQGGLICYKFTNPVSHPKGVS